MGFDLPLWLQRDPTSLLGGIQHHAFRFFVPPKILLSIVDSWLEQQAVVMPPTHAKVLATPTCFMAVDPGYTWISSLRCRLPHSWVDSAMVSTSAVKADAAEIPIHLWDHQITLVLPCTPSQLACFRVLALRFWRRTLLRSLCRCLKSATWRRLV